MNKPTISIIAAISQNLVLGKDNKLLWHIPEDFARFKKITSGHPIIMGRKTFESIGKPLPKRTNIIITRDENYEKDGCLVVHSLAEAIRLAKELPADAKAMASQEIFIIGGGQIFEQAIKLADKLYLTTVEGEFAGDTFFPDYANFKKIVYEKKSQDNNYRYTFLELER